MGTLTDLITSVVSKLTPSTISALRMYTGPSTMVTVTAQGVGGTFVQLASASGLSDDGAITIFDGLGRAWRRVFADTVMLEWFGAKGDGTTSDVAAIQAACNFGYPITLRAGAVYLMDGTVTLNNTSLIFYNTATFRLKSGTIVNTDTSPTNFTPLFRLQGMTTVDLGTAIFDHNRAGQTYPATYNKPGRGSNPFRHNGSVEICPDATGTTPSRNVRVEKAQFINSYLNGLVLWQVQDAYLGENFFQNTTWNGIAGAGLRNVSFFRNTGYRCGESSLFPSLLQTGDRAMIQVREFPIGFTTGTEGIPCITTGEFVNGGINKFINFTGNYGEECGVETIFGRAIIGLSGGNNRSRNVGYGRDPNAGFFPAHIWFEFCEGHNVDNMAIQDTVRAGDAQPDGMVAYSMTGDASALFPLVGNYVLDVSGAQLLSAKSATGAPQPGLLNRGLRVSSMTRADRLCIDGTDNDGVQGTNATSFEATPVCIHDVSFNNSTIVNTNLNQDVSQGGGPVELVRFGSSTGGVPTNIFALNCTVDAGKTVISYNSNLSNASFPPVNVMFSSGPGTIDATSEQIFHTQNAPLYRAVSNTNLGSAAVAGFQTNSNAGNQLIMGTTSAAYSGALGVAASAFVHASGANTGGLFLTATGGNIIGRPGGNRSITMFMSGRTRFGTTTVDDNTNTIQSDGLIGLHSYTVATLPTGINGSTAYASNGRKVGEGAGAGTGVPVYYSNSAWRVYSTDAAVQA